MTLAVAALLLAPGPARATGDPSPTILGPCAWSLLSNSTVNNAFFPEESATYWQTVIRGSLLKSLLSSGLVI